MDSIPRDLARKQLLSVLAEASSESDKPYRYFLAGTGLCRTLDDIASTAAFTPTVVGDPTSTIAAHAYHLVFATERFATQISGGTAQGSWDESWQAVKHSEESWAGLRSSLRLAIDKAREAISRASLATPVEFGRALSTLCHLAYHIGAIEEKVTTLRATSNSGNGDF